jgi:hypothetical protein
MHDSGLQRLNITLKIFINFLRDLMRDFRHMTLTERKT